MQPIPTPNPNRVKRDTDYLNAFPELRKLSRQGFLFWRVLYEARGDALTSDELWFQVYHEEGFNYQTFANAMSKTRVGLRGTDWRIVTVRRRPTRYQLRIEAPD